MKNISLINNEWKERKRVILTDVEEALLNDTSEQSKEQKKALLQRIASESLVTIPSEEFQQAQAIYDANKIEGATLIAADMILPTGTGIINCRLNGEHKQIRF